MFLASCTDVICIVVLRFYSDSNCDVPNHAEVDPTNNDSLEHVLEDASINTI